MESARRKVEKSEFARPRAERWELTWPESGTPEAETTGLAWLLPATLAPFATAGFGAFGFAKLEFGKLESERLGAEWWKPICLGAEKREAATIGFAWSLLGTRARFAKAESESFEFGIREVGKQGAEMCEVTCLGSGTREAEMIGLAWLPLVKSVEFGALEVVKPGAERRTPICLESAGAGKTGFASS